MFENLSTREKYLAMAVLGLLPLALVFGGIFWVSGQLNEKHTILTGMQNEKTELLRRQLEAIRAAKRRVVYRSQSLPSNANVVLDQYESWLTKLGSETVGLAGYSVKSGGPGQDVTYSYKNEAGSAKTDVVFSAYTYSVQGQGTIEQLTEFLYRFQRAKILHRIKLIDVRPILQGTGSRLTISDVLKLRMTVEAIRMADADSERDFEDQLKLGPARSLDDYLAKIAHRNVFGPPNQPPEIQRVSTQRANTGQKTTVAIRTTEKDNDDLLTYELVESSIPDARLTHNDPQEKNAVLDVPGTTPGSYEFLVRVTDNGCPAKSDEAKIVVNVSDPEPPAVETVAEPKPQNARHTYVSALITREDRPQIWVQCMTLGKTFKLFEGDTFELDDRQWKLIKINPPHFVFEVDGEKLIITKDKSLAEPVEKSPALDTPVAKSDGSQPSPRDTADN